MDTPVTERQFTLSVPVVVILLPQIIMGVTKPLVEVVINSGRELETGL
ncbi:hypothetical protein V2J94_31465 [Streptomyces sp. DSM 41524]|uniref:Uncharacterized protein n=1 Tax=Streptomyces asiaticus subsp. ignotus TaxID=3098222 RepID=A0ABU7Q4Q4_9ACTN|nr:hypothetical protein [Streptomyces sp. DSM 41524]